MEYLVADSSAKRAIDLKKELASIQQMHEEGEPIIGAGTNKLLSEAETLAQKYGGQPVDWSKMTRSSYTAPDGLLFEAHWYQNLRSQRVEFKTKLPIWWFVK
jgi:hypothetical protein